MCISLLTGLKARNELTLHVDHCELHAALLLMVVAARVGVVQGLVVGDLTLLLH